MNWAIITDIFLFHGGGVNILPVLRERNCISCLVEKILATRESGEPPNLRACVSC